MQMKTFRMGILGKKLGMTQVFNEIGNVDSITVVQAGPCAVVQKKSDEKEGYNALQLGFDEVKEKSITKPLKGHFAKAGSSAFRLLKEIRIPAEEFEKFSIGQALKADFFQAGEFVDVIGISKGKGFAGVIKRHHFAGFPASHGTHEVKRHGGAIGQASSPGRVFKGTRMAGHMGTSQRTVQNLKITRVIPEKNLLFIKGAVPGASGGYLIIKKALKKPPQADGEEGGK